MASEVSAADGALKAGATTVGQSREALKRELSALEGELSGIGSAWQGQGAVAFTTLMNRYPDATANQIIQTLLRSTTNKPSTDAGSSSTPLVLGGASLIALLLAAAATGVIVRSHRQPRTTSTTTRTP